MRVFVRGLNACLQRKADVSRYKQFILANGHKLVSNPKESDLILLWTCAYRQDLHDHSLRTIDSYKNIGPRLIVCGCLPSINKEALYKHFDGYCFEWKNQDDHMTSIFGTAAGSLENFDRAFIERCIPSELESYRNSHPNYKVTYSDQFLKMYPSEGCKKECTYCAERLAFPNYKSIPIEKLVAECKSLMEQTGQWRVVLWADSLGDYGHDTSQSMPQLVDSLLSLDDRVQVGLENIHPQHCLQYLNYIIRLIKEKRLFLLKTPIQSSVDRILHLMKRDYTNSDLVHIFDAVTSTGFDNFETDIIAGFPTETDEEFRETIAFVINYSLKYALVSGYLETPGMESAKIVPKVLPSEIKQRLAYAQQALTSAGIRCNYDNNEASKERFERDYIDFDEELITNNTHP